MGESIDEMEAGRKLDALVAERIIGPSGPCEGPLEPVTDSYFEFECTVCDGSFRGVATLRSVTVETKIGAYPAHRWYAPHERTAKRHSTNLEDAQQVIDKMRVDKWTFRMDDQGGDPWWAEFAKADFGLGGQASGDSPAVVICRAALKALEDKEA